MGWQYVLTDQAGRGLGELRDAEPRSWSRGIKSGRAAGFTIPTKHPLAPAAMLADKVILKVYDDREGRKRLRHQGPLIGFQRDVGENGRGAIACNSVSPLWRLLTRLVGRTVNGANIATAVSPLDRGEALGRLIDALNAGDAGTWFTRAGDTGIRRGNIAPSSAGFWGPWRWYQASAAWSEILTGLDAPEVDLRPVEPVTDALGLQLAALDIAPALGQPRPDAVFEHGTGRHNVPTFTDIGDAGILANDAWHMPPGFPNTATGVPLEATDATSIADRGLHEVVVAADVATDTLRQQLLADHVLVRKQPRRTVSFTVIRDPDPFGTPLSERRVPRPFIDFDVGDVVPFRAVELIDVYQGDVVIGQREEVTVDALFRVYAMTITPDALGGETVTLVLQEEAS